MTFNPGRMSRDRSQVLFRYRPQQTFDHQHHYTAQVIQLWSDLAFRGPMPDTRFLIDEARHHVRYWRAMGRQAKAAEPGSDRAPEFPGEDHTAHQHYEVVVPGKVVCKVWPLVVRCGAGRPCGAVWSARDPRHGVDPWPPPCPRCHNVVGNRQLQFVFVHPCGHMVPMVPPKQCRSCHDTWFRLDDIRVSRFKDFRWQCIRCGTQDDVQMFCTNRGGCRWTDKRMSPLVHTASSAYVCRPLTVVNPPSSDFVRKSRTEGFVVATLGRWLDECTEQEAKAVLEGAETRVGQDILDAIQALEDAGLRERADELRRKHVPVDLEQLRTRVEKALGYDPLSDDGRGRELANRLSTYQRVLDLPRLTLDDLRRNPPTPGRAARYTAYPAALVGAGFEPAATALVSEFPVTYLAVGYSRGGFAPTDADLVPFRGRSASGKQMTTLLYANPTVTEALAFRLDADRVARWLLANGIATPTQIAEAGDARRWFAARLQPQDAVLPTWDQEHEPDRADPEYGPRSLYRLLHTMAHQVLRALAVDSGFSETALSEHLFPYELAFAIHPNGASEFTIGGLRTVLEQNLDEVVRRAVENDTCIYDPNCMITGGVDHGCVQLPETACQSMNRFLSRWDLFGSHDRSWVGYWDEQLDES